ncbi:glutaredoxin [Ruminococcaceae bacterium OttesenSCG-928-A16]|nr:glutaredoxin [Ruminococcaceae bacterium OttesenSCG-928-A16]
MKELTLFYLENCPYCKRARNYMQELCEENPEYAKIPVKMVEERAEKELADSFDYYYVPCYYIGKDKLAEGSIDKAGVKAVFDKALEE